MCLPIAWPFCQGSLRVCIIICLHEGAARTVLRCYSPGKHALGDLAGPGPTTTTGPTPAAGTKRRLEEAAGQVGGVAGPGRVGVAEALAVLEDGLVQVGQGVGQVQDGAEALGVAVALDLDDARLLVDLAADLAVDDEEAHDVLDLGLADAQLPGDPGQAHARVGSDEVEHGLGAHVTRDLVDVLGNEGVGEEVLVLLEDALVLMDIVPLVRIDQLGHGGDAGVVPVGLRLLAVEGVDVGPHQHGREQQVFEDLDALQAAGFVVVAEGLEEVGLCVLPVLLAHVHFATALPDDAHDLGVGHGRAHLEGPLVQDLELLVVLHLGVHLDLEGEDLEEVSALAGVVGAVLTPTGIVELLKLLSNGQVVSAVEQELGKLDVGLQPEPLVVCGLETFQCEGVEALHTLCSSFGI